MSGLALFTIAMVAIAAASHGKPRRERAEDRRQQAVELGDIAEARKQEADRQRDELRRLSTRLTLDRGLSLLENNDRRAGLLWLARSLAGISGHDPFEHAIRSNIAAWSRSLTRQRVCLQHRRPVRAVAWSPTGQSIATGSEDATARLWDPVSAEPLCPSLEHGGPIKAIRYSHDGKTLATASEDQTARLWNAASGLVRGEVMHHRGPVTSLAFTPENKTLVTASSDGMVRLWDGATGLPRGLPLEHGKPLKLIAISPDGKTVASLDDDGKAILWDLVKSQRRASVEESTGKIQSLAFSPDGTALACGSEDRLLYIVDTESGKVRIVTTSYRHGGPILSVAFNRDGTRIATGSYDTSCRICACPTCCHSGGTWNSAGTCGISPLTPRARCWRPLATTTPPASGMW